MSENRVNIRLDQTILEKCGNCKKPFFEKRTIFRITPGILVGSKQNQVNPFEIYFCSNCGNLHESSKLVLLPKEIEDLKIEKKDG